MRAGCSRVTHPCAGRRQRYCYRRDAPRLACVRPAASVHPEPGSNSSLYMALRPLGPPGPRTDALDSYVSVLALLASLSVLSMNSLYPGSPRCPVPRLAPPPSSRTGLQRYCFFPNLQIFSHFFSGFFASVPGQRRPGTTDRRAGDPMAHRVAGRRRQECHLPREGRKSVTGGGKSCHLAQKGGKTVTGGSRKVATGHGNAAKVRQVEAADTPPGTGRPQECDRWKQQSRHLAQKCRKSVTGGSSRVATWHRKAARV